MKIDENWLRQLRNLAAEIGRAPTLEAATHRLEEFSDHLGFSMIGWAPNISRPIFDKDMDDFMRKQGWSDDVLKVWWDKSLMLKTPLYIRCRSTNIPFVTILDEDEQSISPDGRRLQEHMMQLGLRSLLTTPVHLPLGGVAKITFAGRHPPELAEKILNAATPELISAAHLLMMVYRKRRSARGKAEQTRVELTPKEWECLRLSAQGFRVRDISRILEVKPSTTRFHLQNVSSKLDATTLANAVAIATQLGLLDSILE